jgi:hypothetical protein
MHDLAVHRVVSDSLRGVRALDVPLLVVDGGGGNLVMIDFHNMQIEERKRKGNERLPKVNVIYAKFLACRRWQFKSPTDKRACFHFLSLSFILSFSLGAN